MTTIRTMIQTRQSGRSENSIAPAPSRLIDARLSWSLRLFAYSAAVCSTSAVLIYCYESSLAASRPALVAIHEYSGDAAAALLAVYLVQHLRRTWSLRQSRPVSWWTGLAGAVSWALAAASGVWGQFYPLPRYEALWWIHAAASFAAVVIASGHAAYGFRVRSQSQQVSTP